MTKTDLIKQLAKQHTLQVAEVRVLIDSALEMISDRVNQGERVRLRGFGEFISKVQPARKGRHMVTGKAINIPAKRKAKFKPGTQFDQQLTEKDNISTRKPELYAKKLKKSRKLVETVNQALQSSDAQNQLLLESILKIKDGTTFLWPTLTENVLAGTEFSCSIRESTFQWIQLDMDRLHNAKLLQYTTEQPSHRSSQDDVVFSLFIYQISAELQAIFRDIV
jgi:nucleoid DNA-binding protein